MIARPRIVLLLLLACAIDASQALDIPASAVSHQDHQSKPWTTLSVDDSANALF